jgi:hypothetical protein
MISDVCVPPRLACSPVSCLCIVGKAPCIYQASNPPREHAHQGNHPHRSLSFLLKITFYLPSLFIPNSRFLRSLPRHTPGTESAGSLAIYRFLVYSFKALQLYRYSQPRHVRPLHPVPRPWHLPHQSWSLSPLRLYGNGEVWLSMKFSAYQWCAPFCPAVFLP